jgi:hypothetical protein
VLHQAFGYNDDFLDIHKLITDSLMSKGKNGLILLHGIYGSGKTYYLRHLMSNIDRKFIYFPLNMIDSISLPEFLPFISQQPNAVLILEDCESLLAPRERGMGNASALSNLLNLGDGLLLQKPVNLTTFSRSKLTTSKLLIFQRVFPS